MRSSSTWGSAAARSTFPTTCGRWSASRPRSNRAHCGSPSASDSGRATEEGRPLTGKADEWLVHQTEKPLAQVVSHHAEWQGRVYFNMHDRGGEGGGIRGVGGLR